MKFHAIIDLIPKNDYSNIVNLVAEVALTTDKYLKTNCAVYNPAPATYVSKPAYNNVNLFDNPKPSNGWNQEQLYELDYKVKAKLYAMAKTRPEMTIEKIGDITNCLINQLISTYGAEQFHALPKEKADNYVQEIAKESFTKVGLKI